MNEQEVRRHAVCSLCHEKILRTGLPLFYRVTIERFGMKMDAVRRQHGMELLMGNVALAQVMGPNEDMAMPVMDPLVLVVCETCSMDLDNKAYPIAHLAEFESTVKP